MEPTRDIKVMPTQRPIVVDPTAPVRSKRPMGKIVAALVIILLAAGAYLMMSSGERVTTYDENGNAVAQADPGAIVRGFPMELIREPGQPVTASYSVDYDAQGSRMAVVEYESAETYEQNVDGFRRLFKDAGWVVTKDPSYYERPVTNLAAVKGGDQANATITMRDDGSIVVQIAYTSSN